MRDQLPTSNILLILQPLSSTSALNFVSAFFANTDLFVVFGLVTDTNAFSAFGAEKLQFGCVYSAVYFENAAFIALFSGFSVLCLFVYTLNNSFSLFRGNRDNLTLCAFIDAGNNYYCIVLFNMNVFHFRFLHYNTSGARERILR